LTGPDHLAALVTLSALSDPCASFILGVRWGLGHSTGLLLVALVLIVRDSAEHEDVSETIDMPDSLSHFFTSLVGFFMLFLGAYGFRRAYQKRDGYVTIDCCEAEAASMKILENGLGPQKHESSVVDSYHPKGESQFLLDKSMQSTTDESRQHPSSAAPEEENGSTAPDKESSNWFVRLWEAGRQLSTRSLAICSGLIHGLAGPGGVLAVIPAVQLHNWILATIFLSCFCFSSTLTMGCFACLYGSCSGGVGRRTQLEFQIRIFSSSLSIMVGILWLVLLWIGKMDEIFP